MATKTEKEFLATVKNGEQIKTLEGLAVIFAEDALRYAGQARAEAKLNNEDKSVYYELQDRKMKCLIQLQKVNSEIIKLYDKAKTKVEEPSENSEEGKTIAIVNQIPQL